MPSFARLELEVLTARHDFFGRSVFPLNTVNGRREERTNVLAFLQNHLAGFNRNPERFSPKFFTRAICVDACVNVERRIHRVERARGGMHHVCIVEAIGIAVTSLVLDVVVLLVDLRRLREARHTLVDRLGHDNAGVVLFEVKKHRRGLLHDRDPLLVANPCGVEQNVVAKVTDLINHTASVVDGAVVGAELEHGEANGSFSLSTLGCRLRRSSARRYRR